MTLINCNVAKAASAIFTSKDIEPTDLIRIDDESYTFGVFSEKIGECMLSVSGSPNSVIIEASVRPRTKFYGHPQSKFKLELLESESNDTYVNAALLSIASLAHEYGKLKESISLMEETLFKDTCCYELGDGKEIKDTHIKLLDHFLTNPLPWDFAYAKNKDPEVKDSVDKYVKVDLGKVDINKAKAIKSFFDDISCDRLYDDDYTVDKMMLSSVRDAVNWALAKSGSKNTVDSKTVLTALMSCSLDSRHVVFDEKDEIKDNMVVNVPNTIFDLVILHRNDNK